MDAGKLYHRVLFDEPVLAQDGGGGNETVWTERFSRRAHYKRLRGSEQVLASRLTGVQPTIVTVRFNGQTLNVSETWRIRDARTGEIFNIRSSIISDDRQWLDLTCESGVAV
jgi:SPP1 family predicted phage head-tail adaptor